MKTNGSINKDNVVLGFITGMSRSGTTWVGKSIDKHPDVSVIGETAFWGRKYLKPSSGGMYTALQQRKVLKRLKVGSALTASMWYGTDTLTRKERHARQKHRRSLMDSIIKRTLSPVSPEVLFNTVCKTILENENKQWAIEKTPHHINWLDRIIPKYKNARIIVTFREPYGFMLSYKHQDNRKKEDAPRKFVKLYHPLGSALVWRGYAKAIARALKQYPENCLLINLEQIRNEPTMVMQQIQEFLGLKTKDNLAIPKENTSFIDKNRPELEAEDFFWLHLIAGKEMEKLNLPQVKVKFSILSIIISVLRIPFWGFSVLKRFLNDNGLLSVPYLLRWIKQQ